MERLILKARVAGIDFAPVITTAAALTTATWNEQPVTLRDDEISITESDPEESEVYSHENDAPEDYDIVGTGISATGAFIKATYAQMVTLMGGSVTGNEGAEIYLHPSQKLVLNQAIRFRLKGGGAIVIPNAKGSVQFNSNNGYDGVLKFPFRFRALESGFGTDLVIL
ncbi:MAG: hypothetical protein LBQ73_02245 [Tannerellaceae bacterium]|jgi:hypothetical protein|nr:hypothetical protein [Tannerellaceae bacterium]